MNRGFNLNKKEPGKLTKRINRNLVAPLVTAALFSCQPVYAFENTDYGTNAGASQTSDAEGNTNIGENAGTETTSGDRNTNLGKNAGQSLTTKSDNVMIGYNAGLLNSADANVFIGASAGESNKAGFDNVFIGYRAGLTNLSNDNVFIGADAGLANTYGDDNTFVGEESGLDNTTGDDNTFVGNRAGFNHTEGDKNTFVGARSGFGSNTVALSGSNNTALGEAAGSVLQGTATRNTLVGSGAGGDVSEGFANTLLGASAGLAVEDADYNTFVGAFSGKEVNQNGTDKASRNTALGAFSGSYNREGQDNVWIGTFAGSMNSVYSYNSDIEIEIHYTDNTDYHPSRGPQGATDVNGTVVFGAFAGANDDNSVSIGFEAISDNTGSVTIGTFAQGTAQDDITVGRSATNTSDQAITIGTESSSSHAQAITIGYQATSHADNTVVLGNSSTLNWDPSTDGVTALGNSNYRFTNLYSQAASISAADNSAATIALWADSGTDNSDKWNLSAFDGGDFTISSESSGSDVAVISVSNSGNVTVAGDLTVNSDRRLKNDIQPLIGALALVQKLEAKTYYWNPELNRGGEKRIGLIAQQVEGILPELVTENSQGIRSVNYQGMIPVLIGAVKEFSEQAKQQQKQISLLKQQIQLQQALLAKLTEAQSL